MMIDTVGLSSKLAIEPLSVSHSA